MRRSRRRGSCGDAAFAAELSAQREKLMPNLIGREGQLQEWREDVDKPGNRQPRHMSPLIRGLSRLGHNTRRA